MATNDLYKWLQVDPLADSVVIRAAFHALARKYHPDAGGDLRRMVEINEAWAVLGNPMMRSAYDTEREPARKPVALTDRADPQVGFDPSRGERPRAAGNDSTSKLDFGRYEGWTLGQLVDKDPDYLEWLTRTSIGRRLTPEIKALIQTRSVSRAAVASGTQDRRSGGHGWFGRANSR